MNPYACTNAVCQLAKSGGLVSFPLVTIAGLIDSLNPCAITMIVLLLSSLIIFSKKKERVLLTGLIYIGAVFLTYLVIGLFFYQAISQISQIGQIRFLINKILGGLLLLAGLINVKDYFWPNVGPHLQIPNSSRPFLKKLAEKVSYPAAALLGVLVTLLETPCSLPIYVGTAKILADAGLGSLGVLGYLLYYNFLFTLPLWIILFIAWRACLPAGRDSEWKIVQLQDFEHRSKKWMKLGIGIMLLIMGIWLLL